MDTLILTIASIVAGVIGTLAVTKYYFNRTNSKALTPYLQFYSSLFKEVDEEVRKDLKISYQGISVKELFEIQFIIANTGEKPIRDLIDPLRLIIPNNCSALDASILYIYPEGRKISAKIVKNSDQSEKIDFSFPLLNRDEFFIVKVLIKGNPEIKDFSFTLTADDLPPELKIKRAPFDIATANEKREFEFGLLIAGLIVFILGSSISHLFYNAWNNSLKFSDSGILSFLPVFTISNISIYITGILSFFMLIIGVMMMIGSFTNFSIPKRRKFIIPENLNKFRRDYLIEKEDAT